MSSDTCTDNKTSDTSEVAVNSSFGFIGPVYDLTGLNVPFFVFAVWLRVCGRCEMGSRPP
jgi:hypothetical protein